MVGRRIIRMAGAAAALFAGLSAAAAGEQQSPSNFYAGKTLTVLVGTGASGGFSIYARLIGQYLSKYIPGAPSVVVQNMPGAGGSTAAGYVYQKAPRDGTLIAILTPDSIMDPLFRASDPVRPEKFRYIAGAEKSIRLCVGAGGSPIKTFADALKSQTVIGATQPGSPTSDYAYMIKRGTNAKFKIVLGYGGPGDLYLAMERGEIEGACGVDWAALKSQKPQALRDKSINVLLQVDVESNPQLDKMGVPQPWKYMQNDADKKAMRLMVDFQQEFGKGFVAPPDTPSDRVKILRRAFARVLADKQLLAQAAKMRLDIDPISGPVVGKTVRNFYEAPKSVIARLKRLTAAKGSN